ncbi:MAG: hypothetical protein CMP91_00380 [Gammaproteobacteria bacterium]|nr:hypothetical protein [Gammaproteobacteria bacterium]|tara:strand:- start:75990 stop:77222 length:1233 start_codon:yes stop_codon:yes gene_type:complete
MFLTAKLANFILSVAWGLLLTIILVRNFNNEVAALLLWINAIGLSLSLADLGISKVIFLTASKNKKSNIKVEVSGIMYLYIGISCISTVFCYFLISKYQPNSPVLIASLFFLSASLNLPWRIIYNYSLAIECYKVIEILDVTRKIIFIIFLFYLYIVPNLFLFAFSLNVIWLCILFISLKYTGLGLFKFKLSEFTKIKNYLLNNIKVMGDSVIFHITDFMNYLLPVIFSPILFGLGANVILMDLFYKSTRAATQLYRAFSESRVPEIRKNVLTKNINCVKKETNRVVINSLLCWFIITLVLITFGETIFIFVLDSNIEIPDGFVFIITIFLFLNVIQNSYGSTMVYMGELRIMKFISLSFLICLIGVCLISIKNITLINFLFLYTLIYFISSGLYYYLYKSKINDNEIQM